MRADAQENRRKILQMAEQLFAKKAAGQVTMAQLAQAAGVGVGTLYRNFPTKGDLFLALAYDQLDDYIREQWEYLRQHSVDREVVRQVLQAYLMFREHRDELLPTGSLEAARQFYQRPAYAALIKLFAELISQYEPGLAARTVTFKADMLAAVLRSDSYELQRRARQLTVDQILDQLMIVFFPKKR